MRVWRAPVGRVTVLLLDTDVEENAAEDRRITHVLYGGDREHRLRQEAVLGVGGVRAVRALGLAPTVWHINEGHAAFSVIERLRELTARGLPFPAALETTAASTVFTTHTPVSAGHDVFPRDLVARQFESYPAALGITMDELLELGCAPEQRDAFNMTRLALSGAASVNGVSKIHGGVSARSVPAVLARRAGGREPRRLRDERRARADVPARRLGRAVRQALSPDVARPAHGSRR